MLSPHLNISLSTSLVALLPSLMVTLIQPMRSSLYQGIARAKNLGMFKEELET